MTKIVIAESATYDDQIFGIGVDDLLRGGVNAQLNYGLYGLANRTNYLKSHIDTAEADIVAINDAIALLAPIDSPNFTGIPTAPTASPTDNSTQLATTEFVQTAISAVVVQIWNDRGNWDASGNLFPTTGGSGAGGSVRKGDIWTISVAGAPGGTALNVSDTIRALTSLPGQTLANWAEAEGNLGYAPLNPANNLSDVASVPTARTNLGLGTIATQNASAVAITGGAIDGVVIGGTTPATGTFTALTASGNTLVGSTSPGGTFTIGAAADVSTGISVGKSLNFNYSPAAFDAGVSTVTSWTAVAAGNAAGTSNPRFYDVRIMANGTNAITALTGFVVTSLLNNGAGGAATITGFSASARHQGSGLANSVLGITTGIQLNGAGNVTTASGIAVGANFFTSTGVAVTVNGVQIANQGVAGTTTSHGLNVLAQSGATTNYSIRSQTVAAAGRWNLYIDGTAINHLNGNLLLGHTVDNGVDRLQINGSIAGTTTTQAVFNTVATTVNAFGAATTLNLGAATGTASINNPAVKLTNVPTSLIAPAAGAAAALPLTPAGYMSLTIGATVRQIPYY